MQVIERVINYKSRSNVFRIHPIGDIHAGTQHCALDKVRARIQIIKEDPFALWFGMGDYAEFITPHDPRWDCKVLSDWVHESNIAEDETKEIVKLFKPIKNKCIGLIEGNHEIAYRLHSNTDVQKNICERLGVVNLGYSAFIKLIFRRTSGHARVFLGVVSHGAGGAITRGAKITRLERFMDNFNARWYAHGHVHDVIISEKHYISLTESGEIVSFHKVAAMTGCWFKGYTQGVSPSYAELKNYPPTALGAPVFVIEPDKNIIKVEV